MSVKKDPNGRRYIQLEVEVPGTPEEVWRAISTARGISSWFVPATFEERDGTPATFTLNFGPGMEPTSKVTAWKPPHMWATQSDGWVPGSPPIANEWSVETRAGGSCVVRIVQSLFASTDDWDNQLEGAEYGWPGFLRSLKLYLTHFRGQFATVMKWMVPIAAPEAEAWKMLTNALGMHAVHVGQRCTAPAGAPSFSGVTEHYTEHPYDALLRIEQPAPGICAIGAFECNGQTMAALNFYLFGDQAPATVARETPKWDAWFQQNFPAPKSE